MLGVQQWAEVRRLVLVEGLSQRQVARRLGLARDTVAQGGGERDAAEVLAGGRRGRSWIRSGTGSASSCVRTRGSRRSGCGRWPASWAMRAARRSSMTTCARSARGFVVRRTFQRTVYRPGELVQCDLWEPRELVPVGYGQSRRGWVVTAELCWSRVIAGALIFSKEAPDILWGVGRCLARIGALPEKLVWDRESAIAAGGRPTDGVRGVLRAARGGLGDPRSRGCAGEGRVGALASVHALKLPARPDVREPGRFSAAARRLV